ncbi:MarR family winged helix-turn-helix transcriptional regulator [Paenibacillus sp. N1-5-1-14]|uniref:MarR family winged helix-turn-helix transcriptional regulator n=1 Tax=Paenibacillus radicibacter TaxID=2972488 RepID=UPI00215952AE|nr:MarR family winged helix-turn-helix transcriptional regulator [Paenibacillus radicibacter]MCR8642916.1 MarR family winged helix-turn-helix transcriptional regulator [Paenibacillus radicibacter]
MEDQLFQKFIRFTTAVHEITTDMTKGINVDSVTPIQYRILEYIYVSEDVTLSQISECINMSMPNASREVKKLTGKELCEKITDNQDRRKQYIRLSTKGQTCMDIAFQEIEVRFKQRIESLTEDELLQVGKALDLLQTKVFH